MKPNTGHRNKSLITRKILYFPAFLLLGINSFSQERSPHDSLFKKAEKISALNLENLKFSPFTRVVYLHSTLIPPVDPENERTRNFLDSLKIRASKTLITRKLYEFVITPHATASAKAIAGPSDVHYMPYSGRRIRNIIIQRLNVFGSDIHNPDFSEPNKLENLLNKTHLNTNENIIRKNLLFNEGDTVSPLTLSDNERLIRQLPYIDDARIILIPVSDEEADVLILTKDVYSLGGKVTFGGLDKGSVSIFEKNIFGMGHEFGIEVPYNSDFKDSPGLGVYYQINNIWKTFINLNVYYIDGLGKKTYGFDLTRKLVSASTKYAGGISVREMFTSNDLDSMSVPAPVKYNLQDYWLSRSFLINEESVSRFILGIRYTNNNVFDHPFILPESFHNLQQYKMFLGSASFSVQKFYKASLIYGYGRTEDIPHGRLVNITLGKEINEFKKRTYFGTSLSVGESIKNLGYLYGSAGFSSFFNKGRTEQGMLMLRANFISNLTNFGKYRIRNFINVDYTRGFDRYTDEYLVFNSEDGFSGFGK